MLIRSHTNEPLSHAELRKAAPSIFATEPWDGLSARYHFVNTANIIDTLEQNGFFPIQANQGRARKLERLPFARHQVIFRRTQDFGRQAVVGELVPEVSLTNSHDGSGAYWLHCGIWRWVCCNGAVVSDSTLASVRIAHSSKELDNVIEGVFQIVGQSDGAIEQCLSWQDVRMDPWAQMEFAKEAALLRWTEETMPVLPVKLLTARRPEDEPNTLYHTYQRVQENLLKGGKGSTFNANGRRRAHRGVKGITENTKINQELWDLALKYAA